MINVYARGVNPMVSVSYDNYSNNAGSLSARIDGIGQASLPYKVQNVRPPVWRQEDLLPLSRLPRVWNHAETNPEFPFYKHDRQCNTTSKSILADEKQLRLNIPENVIDNTRPTITDDAIRMLPRHSIIHEVLPRSGSTNPSHSDSSSPSLSDILPSHDLPLKCIKDNQPVMNYRTPLSYNEADAVNYDEHDIADHNPAIARNRQIYEAFTFFTSPHARDSTDYRDWNQNLQNAVKDNLLIMNARAPASQPSVAGLDNHHVETTSMGIHDTPLHSYGQSSITAPFPAFSAEGYHHADTSKMIISNPLHVDSQTNMRAERGRWEKIQDKNPQTRQSVHETPLTVSTVMPSSSYERESLASVGSASQSAAIAQDNLHISGETQKTDVRSLSFADQIQDPHRHITDRDVMHITTRAQPTRHGGDIIRDGFYEYESSRTPLHVESHTQRTGLAQGHPFEHSERTFEPVKNLPLHESRTNPVMGEYDFSDRKVLERERRVVIPEEEVQAARGYSGMEREEHVSQRNRNVRHLMPDKVRPKDGFLDNRQGVDYFANRDRQVTSKATTVNTDWSSVKTSASQQMQERFRLT
jgi:hypothetical protein